MNRAHRLLDHGCGPFTSPLVALHRYVVLDDGCVHSGTGSGTGTVTVIAFLIATYLWLLMRLFP